MKKVQLESLTMVATILSEKLTFTIPKSTILGLIERDPSAPLL